MGKLKMKSGDAVDGNVAKIAALFPQCVTERLNKDGKPELAIEFDKLRAELSKDVLDEGEERYQFTWPDKRAASRLANTPTDKTLRPDVEASKDFWNTENLYIEGDNLDVLKVLRENYLGKIKMIYIDPPYNTGNDFVYNDDFAQGKEDFEATSGLFDEDGNQVLDPMQRNTESNGRFHTDWLNMIYPRLKVARDLLSDDGVIFISIDDNEVHNLRKVCDDVFGSDNFLGCAGRISKKANNQGDYWAPNFDYVLTFAKNKEVCPAFFGGINYSSYNLIEEDGPRKGERYQLVRLYMTSLDPMRGCTNQRYYIQCPDGSFIIPPGEVFPSELSDGASVVPNSGKDKVWRWSYQSYLQKKDQIVIKQGRSSNVVGPNGEETKWNAFTKTYLNDVISKLSATPNSFIEGHINQNATHELKALGIPFPFAKPSSLLKYFEEVCQLDDGDIVLDFFSGSGTLGDATMQYNKSLSKKVKYICVQIPERCSVESDEFKAGYENICQIGEERIRRAGEKVKEEAGDKAKDLDVGFRVLKLDSSNMEDVFYTPEEFDEQRTLDFVDNVKSDRTPLDLLFQVMPELGIELSAKIEERDVNGKKVFFVDGTYLIATFDTEVNESTVNEIAKMKPQYFVMRDASAANDNVLDNFEQIFKHYSPDTIRKIL
ncbi:MAG: site-specific DNA-methyltransferase [Barnesiella sp.]|nr:site-specific DNA-methyltransferase [Barnesiella sp.]